MAKYGWDDLRMMAGIVGETWTEIHTHVDNEDIPAYEAGTEDYHPKGQAVKNTVATGTNEVAGEIKVEGIHDDAVGSVEDVLWDDGAHIGASAQIAESYDGGTTWDYYPIIVKSYRKVPASGGGSTRYEFVGIPNGTPTLGSGTTPSGTVS